MNCLVWWCPSISWQGLSMVAQYSTIYYVCMVELPCAPLYQGWGKLKPLHIVHILLTKSIQETGNLSVTEMKWTRNWKNFPSGCHHHITYLFQLGWWSCKSRCSILQADSGEQEVANSWLHKSWWWCWWRPTLLTFGLYRKLMISQGTRKWQG